MIAGVAAGLANYFNIDAVIVRLLFVITIFFGGAGVLAYIILWLVVPEAKTASERLSMQGKPATLENLKRAVERADVPGAARRGGSAAAKVIMTIGKVGLFVVGLPLAIVSGLSLLWLGVIAVYFLLNGAKVAGQVVAPIGGHEVTAFVAGVIACVTLLLALLLIGVSMMRRRWQLPAWGVAALVGVFFVAASIGGAFAADVVPRVHDRVESLHHSSTANLSAFTRAELTGHDTRFSFVPDTKTFVEYRYFGNVDLHKISAGVADGTLVLNTDAVPQQASCNIFCIYSGPDLQVIIHAPQLTNVRVAGEQANFLSDQTLHQPGMSLTVAGNALASVVNVYPSAATLTDSNNGNRKLDLTFGAGARPDDGVMIDTEANQGIVSFNRVGSLNVVSDRQCDGGDPYIFVLNDVNSLQLNGKAVASGEKGYNALRSPDANSLINCVIVRADAPPLPEPPVLYKWQLNDNS